jgi:hypothetical protein
MRTYAAQLEDDVVVQVIVGTADWAVEHLGGTWVDTPVKVGPGWVYVDGELLPPAPADDDLGDPDA